MEPSGETMLVFREQAMALVGYDPITGDFRWKVKRNGFRGNILPGAVAGKINDNGYRVITIMGRSWRAHRLAWLFVTGATPPTGYEIDHINGNRGDNRWTNLRAVTRQQNNYNLGLSKRNMSGTKGVSWVERRGVWLARIKVAGRVIHLGEFQQKADAIAARKAGEQRYHGEFARKAA